MNHRNGFGPGSVLRLSSASWLIPIGLAVLSFGCGTLNALMPWRAIDEVMPSLPEPEGVVLIQEVEGVEGGLARTCYGAYAERLYGAQLDFNQVLAFYEQSLPPQKWHKIEGRATALWASPSRHFAVAAYSNVHASRFPSTAIRAAQRQHPTLYILVLSYVNHPSECRRF